MSRGLNKVMLIGNLGADPEIRHTNGGMAVATLRLATAESWKDREPENPKIKQSGIESYSSEEPLK